MKNVAMQFISFAIGNGEANSLWFDSWWRNGCLASSKFSPIIRKYGMASNAVVGNLLAPDGWVLPTPNARQRLITRVLT